MEGVVKEEKFLHTQESGVGGWGQLQNFRGECGNSCSEGKTERLHHRDGCWTALSS